MIRSRCLYFPLFSLYLRVTRVCGRQLEFSLGLRGMAGVTLHPVVQGKTYPGIENWP